MPTQKKSKAELRQASRHVGTTFAVAIVGVVAGYQLGNLLRPNHRPAPNAYFDDEGPASAYFDDEPLQESASTIDTDVMLLDSLGY